MRTIRELQTRLNLDEESLGNLLDHGKLDGRPLDSEVLAKVRQEVLKAARRKPTKH
jgi:hypothetical protein